MAMAPWPSESAGERQSEWEQRWASAGWCGVLDGVDGLTGGANTGIQVPNGSQVLRWSATTADRARH